VCLEYFVGLKSADAKQTPELKIRKFASPELLHRDRECPVDRRK
jgi:hypothetical protein